VDVCIMIRQRLEELGLEQKDLAAAAGVTDSYISQLFSRKKLPPAPDRTDIYSRIGKFLKLPVGKLSELAEHQRVEELKKELSEPPVPLFKEVRELVLHKCAPEKRSEIRSIFEKQPFGELERLVTQKLLDVVQKVAKQELESESWLKLIAQMSGRSYEEMRVSVLEFLDTDAFDISAENCISYLDPLIDSWDIDLANFGMEIVLNRRLAPAPVRKLEFVETDASDMGGEQPGLQEFLGNSFMRGNASDEEIAFLRRLKFTGKRPTALYYYRELQNLRDPLNFRESSVAPLQKYADAANVEKQMQIHAREGAIQRWTENKASPSRKKQKSKTAR
jgi:transcriptional regulator with XRE-family HTH domain